MKFLQNCAGNESGFGRHLEHVAGSADGSRFVETMLTVIEMCRQQGRNTFVFVADAVQAHFAGRSAPSLPAGV